MLQKSQRSGQHNLMLVMGCAWLFAVPCRVLAWDEASQDQPVASPDYNAILAEKISQNHLMLTENGANNLMDAALNPPGEANVNVHTEAASVGASPFANRLSAGWQLPVNETLTTGPVAQYAVDPSPLSCSQCKLVDRSKDDHIASLGWRIDSVESRDVV